MTKDQRLRDPVHGLITFRGDDPIDQLAWRLLDAPEFQRLRRIRQLGVSEFVFPSATHTRFAHCVGVFHTARTLVGVIRRERPEGFDERRASLAIVAALLHDVGHGPFSHTFERVQAARGVKRNHEDWSADIILNPDGAIAPLLRAQATDGDLAQEIAALLRAEDPADIYHAVVSSSFDADRLDYLRRDRLMTGTMAGAIDFDWLMEHVRVRDVETAAPDATTEHADRAPTFCLDAKATPAAEQFLLARYTLHEQVYFHKTTRCVEYMMNRLLGSVAELAHLPGADLATGLATAHPLIRFFAEDGATISNYLALDDAAITGALEPMERAADAVVADIAARLRRRRLYKTLDIREFGRDEGRQRMLMRRIDETFADQRADGSVGKDDGAGISIYTQIGGDDDRTHKKLHILDAGRPREISELSPLVQALAERQPFTRYYFEREEDRDRARGLGGRG